MNVRPDPPASSSGSRGSNIRLAALVLILATVAAYSNTFFVPFVFDDAPSIVENPSIRRLWPLREVLFPQQAGGLTTSGRPVVNLSLALNYAMSGNRVGGYHATNLAIHVCAGLCLFGVVRRTLLRPVFGGRFDGAALPVALAAASIWALHPLQTESVTYVVQRAESLAGLFYLLTLYAFIRGMERGAPRGWLALAIGACFLGMATKEIVVSAPIILFLYDRTFVGGTFRAAWQARRVVHLALAATWIPLACLVLATGGRGGTAGFGIPISSWTYSLTQCEAIVRYLGLSLWPEPMVFDYGIGAASGLAAVFPQAIMVVALLAGVAVALHRRPVLGFAGAWFFALLAPSSSFVPVMTQTVAEHRMYLPLAAVAVLVVAGLHACLGLRRVWLAVGIVCAMGLATRARNRDYRSELTLWGDTAAKVPANARAQNNFGQALYRAGMIHAAIERYASALRLQPNYPESHYNLGVAQAELGRVPVAIEHYEAALRLQPDYPEAHNNLGNALMRVDRVAEAMRHYEEAKRRRPHFAEAHNNLGNALLASDRAEEATLHFERALRLRPDYPEARYNLGNALAAAGKMSDALSHYREALRLRPDYAEAHVNAGNALLSLEQLPGAVSHYEKALALDPKLAEAANNLGTVFLHTGRVAEAIPHFERALAARPDFADAQRNLAEARAQLRTPARRQ